jgi:anti-sigma-K factor RskA
MSERARERDEAISAYLLGELDAAARTEFELRLADDPALREEVEALRPVVSRLAAMPAETWNPPEPPALALPSEAFGEAQPERGRVRVRSRRWAPARFALAGAAAALLLGAGVWIGTLVDDGAPAVGPPAESSIGMTPPGPADDGARGELTLAGGAGDRASLTVSGLTPNDDDYYEVWLLGEGGLVSLGSFRVGEDGGAAVDLQLPVDPSRYGSYDISLEPDDGDPSHSSESVLRGPTAS